MKKHLLLSIATFIAFTQISVAQSINCKNQDYKCLNQYSEKYIQNQKLTYKESLSLANEVYLLLVDKDDKISKLVLNVIVESKKAVQISEKKLIFTRAENSPEQLHNYKLSINLNEYSKTLSEATQALNRASKKGVEVLSL